MIEDRHYTVEVVIHEVTITDSKRLVQDMTRVVTSADSPIDAVSRAVNLLVASTSPVEPVVSTPRWPIPQRD